jgi:UDP-N-acetylmuramyl pentapeptide phosphotransferase/UDP-N-acetylglucosamine-1-phosphate transferase
MNALYTFFPVSAFVISVLTNKFLLVYLNKKGVLDIPNERSSHKIPIPRGGGIGIVIGVMLSGTIYALIQGDTNLLLMLFLSLVMGIVGWVDDFKKGLHTGLRFGIQLICSIAIIWIFSPIDKLPLPAPMHFHMYRYGIIISIIWLMGITNIFNFLDGIDGYAGTQGFIAGIMLAVITWGTPIALAGLLISAACAGFLLYNWHPAKIFMGDVGSSFLGFLFAALPFYLKDKPDADIRSQVFFGTAVILWFFLLDGTFTMFRRLFKKEKIWQAHRSHLYQRLVISGLKHSDVVLTVCFFYFILFVLILFYAVQPHSNIMQWPVLITAFTLFFIYLIYTSLRENRRREQDPKKIV